MARDEAELLEMGARITRLRKDHGFKQQWIADQIGVELRTYQFWQAGENAPEQENLEKLAALFDVTPKYILRGETPDPFSEHAEQLKRMEDALSDLTELVQDLHRELVVRDAEGSRRSAEDDPPADQTQPQRPE